MVKLNKLCLVALFYTFVSANDDYFLGSSFDCPSGSRLAVVGECQEAATQLSIHYWGSNQAAPIGCWKHVNPVNGATHVFANNIAPSDPSGIVEANLTPICKPVTTTTTTSPESTGAGFDCDSISRSQNCDQGVGFTCSTSRNIPWVCCDAPTPQTGCNSGNCWINSNACPQDRCQSLRAYCENGSTCVDGVCVCPSGFTGTFCEIPDAPACTTGLYEPKAIHVTDNTADGRQWYPIIEQLTDGRFVVAWDDMGTEDNMFRVYSQDLEPWTDAVPFGRDLTYQSSWGWQARESVRALPGGGFVMVVHGADVGATYLNGRLEMKIFDSSLGVTHTTKFGADQWGEPHRSTMNPKIVLLEAGGFMVTFTIGDCGSTWSCFAAQIFDSSANAVGEWFYIDGHARGGDETSLTALQMPGGPWSGGVQTSVSLRNGNVLIVHSGMNSASAGTTHVSIWDSTGSLVKPHFLIPDVVATRSHQSDHYPHAALLSNGNVVIAWTWYQRENADGTGRDQRQLLFQILDQDGNKIGSNQRVWGPIESTGDADLTLGGYVMVAATEGKFTISSYAPGVNYNLKTRTFLNDGTIDGPIVSEMEGLVASYVDRAVLEYGHDTYVMAVQAGRFDGVTDAAGGIFLIGKECVNAPTGQPSLEPTMNPTIRPSSNPTSHPTAPLECPSGWIEMVGQSMDAEHTTYTATIEDCAQACVTGLPVHGGRQPRECHSFQWSPSVKAGNDGQCWRFVGAKPTDTTSNRGPDFKFCSDGSTLMPSSSPTRNSCPNGWLEMAGQIMDAAHVTYTSTMEECAQSCITGLPTHGGRQPRECNSFQWSPTVTAGILGQCWRFIESTPTEAGNRGPDFTFCSGSALTAPPTSSPTEFDCDSVSRSQNCDQAVGFTCTTSRNIPWVCCDAPTPQTGCNSGNCWINSNACPQDRCLSLEAYCENGSSCVDGVCVCPSGFTGTFCEIPPATNTCPTGWVEMAGQNMDADYVTYTLTMEDCAEACTSGTPVHGGRPPRVCHAFQWSPSVRAGAHGQCWRFVEPQPTMTSNRGPDFTFCSDGTTPTEPPTKAPTEQNNCPIGWEEKVGQSMDSEHTTYTATMEDCARACVTGLPVHGGRQPRECHSFQWSPSVRAGNDGQCWRFVGTEPTDTTANRGPDFTFCSEKQYQQAIRMEVAARGLTRADFQANPGAFVSALATSLGVGVTQVEASLEQFLRRQLSTEALNIYARIRIENSQTNDVYARLGDQNALQEALAQEMSGVSFDVVSYEMQPLVGMAAEPDSTESGVSTGLFVVVVLLVLVIGFGCGVAGFYFCSPQNSRTDVEDPMGNKRVPELQKNVSLQEVSANAPTAKEGESPGM